MTRLWAGPPGMPPRVVTANRRPSVASVETNDLALARGDREPPKLVPQPVGQHTGRFCLAVHEVAHRWRRNLAGSSREPAHEVIGVGVHRHALEHLNLEADGCRRTSQRASVT